MIGEIITQVQSGDKSALVAYAELKNIEKELKAALAEIQPDAVADAERYGEKTFNAHGYSFELRQGSRRWNFKNIPAWGQKKSELAEIEDKAKHAYTSWEKGLLTASADGEEMELPQVTYTSPAIVVKPQK